MNPGSLLELKSAVLTAWHRALPRVSFRPVKCILCQFGVSGWSKSETKMEISLINVQKNEHIHRVHNLRLLCISKVVDEPEGQIWIYKC